MVLFWPALFALEGGDGPEATEYAQLKGEYEAARQASEKKEYSIDSRSPEEDMKYETERDRVDARDAVDMLSERQMSSTLAPASCSVMAPIICSSV